MDIDDDLAFAWPFWKFGLKRDDLDTKLAAQYNTVPSAIQDPTAFHHDVYEISKIASTAAEFHSLLAVRKEQRLHELNHALETASLAIVSNPRLISSERWALAVSLFRNRSLDTLVRYFASYLPENETDEGRVQDGIERQDYGVFDEVKSLASSAPSLSASSYTHSVADTISTVASAVASDTHHHPFFPVEEDHKPLLTQEPLLLGGGLSTDESGSTQFASSPLTQLAEGLAQTSCADDAAPHPGVSGVLTPPRTASCSGSDLDISEPEYSQVSDTDIDTSPIMTLSDTSDTGYVHVVERREFLARVARKSCRDPASQDDQIDAPFSLPPNSGLRRKRSRVSSASSLTQKESTTVDSSQDAALFPGGQPGGDSETPTPRPEPVSASSYLDAGVRRSLVSHTASPFKHVLAPLSSRRIRSCSPAPRSTPAKSDSDVRGRRTRYREAETSPSSRRITAFGPPKRIQKAGQQDGYSHGHGMKSRGRAPWRKWMDAPGADDA